MTKWVQCWLDMYVDIQLHSYHKHHDFVFVLQTVYKLSMVLLQPQNDVHKMHVL